jgi:tetratricopeptide (TPR) repeat protein
MKQRFQRNDFCRCGSGKKYKRCCLEKDEREQFTYDSEHRKERGITLLEMTITGTPIDIEDGRNKLSSADEKELCNIYVQMQSTTEQPLALMLIQRLLALRAKYPNYPVLLNYLVTTYTIAGQKDQAKRVFAELVAAFPRYLFGKIMLAQQYLEQDDPEKAFEAMGKRYVLRDMYPERDTFHVSEVKAFHSIVFRCCFALGDFRAAYQQYKMLKKIHEVFDGGCPRAAEQSGFADIEFVMSQVLAHVDIMGPK